MLNGTIKGVPAGMSALFALSRVLLLCVAIISISWGAETGEDWPGKGTKGAPIMVYSLRTSCGDFVRAKEGSPEYERHTVWVMGYVSGLNVGTVTGGNVLGGGKRKIEDFMILVKRHCEENPLADFTSAVSVSLTKMQPVDWKGRPPAGKP